MLPCNKRRILTAVPGSPWAGKMVLNPAMAADPAHPETIHMLFRATGPGERWRQPGQPAPYPIFLGYGVSRDGGKSWDFDTASPAMAPALEYAPERLMTRDAAGRECVNYANGCIEDPRLFEFEGALYLTVACRTFPPGPYWEHDDPVQCMPEWARDPDSGLGRAVLENSTVSLLYRVDLAALAARDYPNAFGFIAPLHPPDVSDDRDVVLFPRRLVIDGKPRIVCLHRPKHPWHYAIGRELKLPSIFIAAADELTDFARTDIRREVYAAPSFPWEANRIGASWAPLETAPGEWLLPYHGKQDDRVGYTQSFMLLTERASGFPKIAVRPAERLLYADLDWELEGDFTIPCLFTCSGLSRPDGRLLMGYGAADNCVGLVDVDYAGLLASLRSRI